MLRAADVMYKMTDCWSPQHERCVAWNERDLGVTWPLPAGANALISDKDREGKPFRDAECYP